MGKNKKPMKLRSSSWTHASLYVIIFSGLVAITAFVGFELSFIQQAASSGNTSRWNIVIVVGLVGGLVSYTVIPYATFDVLFGIVDFIRGRTCHDLVELLIFEKSCCS